MGDVYGMNTHTGRQIWKTPVGAHNGHDNDSLMAFEHRSTLKPPFTILPGPLGGVLTDLAAAGKRVYVATLDLPLTFTSLDKAAPGAGPPTGEVEALSLATGRVQWDRKPPQLPLGGVTVSRNLLFTTLYDGELIALNRTMVYRRRLPTSANSPIAIAGNAVIVPAGGPMTKTGGPVRQIVAYTVPWGREAMQRAGAS
jgi:outer membrane protein assembly factor BamB